MSEFEEEYWWFVGRRKIIETILKKELNRKSQLRILDVGCGTGKTTLSLIKFGNVYGVDSSFSALKHCSKRGLNKVLKCSSYQLPFRENTFDLVTLLDALEHIENDVQVLEEIKRISKKDSLILLTVPAYQFLWSEHDIALSHYRRYTSKTLTKVLKEAGFDIVRMSYFMSFLFPLVAAYRLISKRKKTKSNPKADLTPLPTSINEVLKKILILESHILYKTDLPFGLSIACVAKN